MPNFYLSTRNLYIFYQFVFLFLVQLPGLDSYSCSVVLNTKREHNNLLCRIHILCHFWLFFCCFFILLWASCSSTSIPEKNTRYDFYEKSFQTLLACSLFFQTVPTRDTNKWVEMKLLWWLSTRKSRRRLKSDFLNSNLIFYSFHVVPTRGEARLY